MHLAFIRKRKQAERIGRTLLAKLLLGQQASTDHTRASVLTLGDLLERYFHDAVTFLDNMAESQPDLYYSSIVSDRANLYRS